MGRKIYFDTNIFDHLVKGIGITEAEERALRSAVNSGHISVLLSYLNLEEVMCFADISRLGIGATEIDSGNHRSPPTC